MANITLILRCVTDSTDLATESMLNPADAAGEEAAARQRALNARIDCLSRQAELNISGLGSGHAGHVHGVTKDGISVFSISPEPAWVSRTLTYKAPGGATIDTVVCGSRGLYRETLQRFKLGVELNPTYSFTDVPT